MIGALELFSFGFSSNVVRAGTSLTADSLLALQVIVPMAWSSKFRSGNRETLYRPILRTKILSLQVASVSDGVFVRSLGSSFYYSSFRNHRIVRRCCKYVFDLMVEAWEAVDGSDMNCIRMVSKHW